MSCPGLQDRRWDKACSCEEHRVGLLVGHCIKVCVSWSSPAKPDGSPVSSAVTDLHLLQWSSSRPPGAQLRSQVLWAGHKTQ